MAVKRQGNFLGQQRVDIPHLRSIESGVAGDFDSLAGKAMAGGQALVVAGFTLSNITPGLAATGILLNVASGILLAATASESGTIFTVAAGAPAETFLSTNAKLSGSFAPSTTNYIGLDLLRAADATTTDLVRFLSTAPTAEEYTQTVPLARTLDYSIVISTTDFNTNTNLVPIAKVVTDGSNNIVSVTDCRQMMHRLGTGGTTPVPLAPYSWTDTNRNESASADIFAGGDKNISSQWEWGRAVMGRLWELGGGEYWYSPSADRNVRCVGDPGSYFIGGENFEWDGTNLHWQGVRFVFANSTGWYNNVTAVTLDTPGLTDLANPGDCIYVDVDRTSNATVSAVKGNLATLTMPTIPGSRFVLAWRPFATAYIFTILGGPNPVGGVGGAHANAAGIYGIVTLTANAGEDAVVPGSTAAGLIVGTGISRYDNSPIGLGAGTVSIGTNAAFDTSVSIGRSGGNTVINGSGNVNESLSVTVAASDSGAIIGDASGVTTNGFGVWGIGKGTGQGVLGTIGATGSIGVEGSGAGATTNGIGVKGTGKGTGQGVLGVITSTGSVAVEGDASGATTNGTGVKGTGKGTGQGVYGILNGGSGSAVEGDASGATTNGTGVKGTGKGNQPGVQGTGGANNGRGVAGFGGATNGTGVYGEGGATNGVGVLGAGSGAGEGVRGTSGTGYGGVFHGNATRANIRLVGLAGAPTGEEGAIYYNSSDGHFYGYSSIAGGSWRQLDN